LEIKIGLQKKKGVKIEIGFLTKKKALNVTSPYAFEFNGDFRVNAHPIKSRAVCDFRWVLTCFVSLCIDWILGNFKLVGFCIVP